MSAAATGYEPLADEDWPLGLENVRDQFAGRLNVYRVMAHHPALLGAWAALRHHLVVDSSLTAETREIVTLRVGHHWRARYEWAQHVVRGRQAGLSDERIRACGAAVAAGPDRLIIEAVDLLFHDARIDGAVRAALERLIGRHGLFDLMATIGFYTTLAFILNSFDVPIEPEILAAIAERPLLDGSLYDPDQQR